MVGRAAPRGHQVGAIERDVKRKERIEAETSFHSSVKDSSEMVVQDLFPPKTSERPGLRSRSFEVRAGGRPVVIDARGRTRSTVFAPPHKG